MSQNTGMEMEAGQSRLFSETEEFPQLHAAQVCAGRRV